VIFSYRVYGFDCASDVPIPGYSPAPLPSPHVDLAISIGSQPDWACQALTLPSRLIYAEPPVPGALISACTLTSFGSDRFFELAYGDGARFVIDNAGTRLWAAWSPPLIIDDLAIYLRGSVMGFVLRRRGITSLHASAVRMGAHAVVLCGATESGKSTTAAALGLRGVSVLSDDIVPLREEENGAYQVEPGYPWICLWPESVRNLLGNPNALPRLTPSWEKCYLSLNNGAFDSMRRPVGAIYVLAPRNSDLNTPRIEEMSGREAVLELVQNTYMNWLLDKGQRAAELDVLSRLASNVPVRRLIPHADPARIDLLCDLIVRDSEAAIGRQSLVRLASPR